jgi:LPS export ABC transporter protein LptC
MNNSIFKFRILFFIATIFFVSAINSCSNKLEEINALTKSSDLPDIEISNLNTSYNSGGQMKIKLNTPSALKFVKNAKDYTEFPKGLKLTFFDLTGKKHSELIADYGIYEEGKKYAKVEQHVILTNTNGTKLETEELFFDEKKEQIYTQKKVKITETNGFTIEGAGGFISNFDFTVYRFTDVSGIIIQDTTDELLSGDENDDVMFPIKKTENKKTDDKTNYKQKTLNKKPPLKNKNEFSK